MLPLKDNVPTRTFPLVTVGLIAANIIVWLWEYKTGVDKEVLHYGYYPCTLAGPCETRLVPPDHLPWYEGVFSSMFMHGSWFHIGGNMLFLWVFGNNIEDRMGALPYLAFYLLAGLVATVAHTVVQPNSSVPIVGASGAIAGVMGAYLVLFPDVRIRSVIFLFFILIREISAKWWLVFWFVLQFFTNPSAGVAWVAHVGGFLFGAMVALLLRDRLRPTPAIAPY